MTKISGVGSENATPAANSLMEVETAAGVSERVQIQNLPKAFSVAAPITNTGGQIAIDAATTSAAGKVELLTDAEALAGTDTSRALTAANAHTLLKLFPDGTMWNGKIVVTVSSNDLVVTIKTQAGNDPSASDPVWVKINGTARSVTAALSVTKADGTSWAALGAAEHGGLEHDLFVYAVWNTNLNPDAVDVFWSRIPYGTLYSDFSATTTNEKYAAVNATAPAATDDCVVIGRFAATLSLVATSHLWTVPTFTNANLIQKPIFSTRELNFTPVFTNMTLTSGTLTAKYVIDKNAIEYHVEFVFGASSAISGDVSHTLPFSRNGNYGGVSGPVPGTLRLQDSGVAGYVGVPIFNASLTAVVYKVAKTDATYATQAALSSTVPFTWGTSDELFEWTRYFI